MHRASGACRAMRAACTSFRRHVELLVAPNPVYIGAVCTHLSLADSDRGDITMPSRLCLARSPSMYSACITVTITYPRRIDQMRYSRKRYLKRWNKVSIPLSSISKASGASYGLNSLSSCSYAAYPKSSCRILTHHIHGLDVKVNRIFRMGTRSQPCRTCSDLLDRCPRPLASACSSCLCWDLGTPYPPSFHPHPLPSSPQPSPPQPCPC